MTSKKVIKEFVVQKGFVDNLSPVTYPSAWSSFMNTYAAWDNTQGDSIVIRKSLSLQAGYYYVIGAADNSGSININGQYNINCFNFNAGISRTTISQNTRIYHGGGNMSITITASNFGQLSSGNPRGVAFTISTEKNINLGLGTAPGILQRTEVGDLVWSTRTNLTTSDQGRYTVVMPFKATITAYAWGAGGGAGGTVWGELSYYSIPSAAGASGLYNTTTFTVEAGDTLEVFVGKGGTPGESGWPRNPGGIIGTGGVGGASRTNVSGNNVLSFNGGNGGSTRYPSAGAGGGGGGGASGVLKNNIPILVAGGGGGSGGAGWDNPYLGETGSWRFASITNNAIGQTPTDYRGEDGSVNIFNTDFRYGTGAAGIGQQYGSGGGGGGGGGGYPGGQGGRSVSARNSGFAGQCGGNFPPNAASTGQDSPYFKTGFGAGGPRSSGVFAGAGQSNGPGQNGRVVLEIAPQGLTAVKVGGAWKQIQQAYVKIGGSWKNINNILVKVGNSWKPINGVGAAGDFDLLLTSGNYAKVNRPYNASS